MSFWIERLVEHDLKGLIVVDAIIDDARRFYKHHNFEPLPGNSSSLIVRLSTAAKARGIARP